MSTSPQTNGYDKARAAEVIDAIEGLKAEQRRIKQEAADKIAPQIGDLSQQIGAKLKEAKKAWGIPTHILKAQLKIRDFQRKENEVAEGLDDEDQEQLGVLRESLGELADLPLFGPLAFGSSSGEPDTGTKTAERKSRKAKQNAELDAIAGAPGDVVATNVTRLETGIKTKH